MFHQNYRKTPFLVPRINDLKPETTYNSNVNKPRIWAILMNFCRFFPQGLDPIQKSYLYFKGYPFRCKNNNFIQFD